MLDGEIRIATEADLDQLTTTLWLAFRDDPLWSWAFPDRRKLEPWWRFLVHSALRHRQVSVLGDYAAVAVWIPPGCKELSDEDEQQVEGLVGSRAVEIMQLLERFEHAHPHEPAHYYLSLLGAHPDHRGRGLGMGLLSENLRQIDEQGHAAYLESSNPANDRRYRSLGFERVGEFSTPDGSQLVSTMWRAPAAKAG